MIFVKDSIQIVQRKACQGSPLRVWRHQIRRTRNSHDEISRWTCATDWRRNGTIGHYW